MRGYALTTTIHGVLCCLAERGRRTYSQSVPRAAKPGGEEKKADAKGAAPYKSCIWKFGMRVCVFFSPAVSTT